MTILHFSDTHSQHRRLTQLPEADILIHSGDFTMNGSEQEAIDFMNWFCDLHYFHKISIYGNRDAICRHIESGGYKGSVILCCFLKEDADIYEELLKTINL